ncbi:TerD family protein [Yinghuangia sp. ASG 101]|uniref:TerD family protein n=1 Tax=Yinghuangia sp. ASG 101 TaxID=2896848 RepID=UPI001E3C4518|nr:TerD family protein [Yinghuangia sp. ASG 101]UGQ15686.1 TerD family protein [Yinghuangia sp. ASG 101]
MLAKGGNHPLDAASVVVEIASEAAMDVSALLLGATGKVRSDADFVFYNQPQGPGVRHEPGPTGGPATVRVDTSAVPASVDRVVVVLSLDGSGAERFGAVRSLTAAVRDAATGREVVGFAPAGLGVETALLLFEIYRRGPGWKVRAVGQGYANGLAGIATDFGVRVDDPPPPTAVPPTPVPTRPAAPAPSLPPPPPPPPHPAPAPHVPVPSIPPPPGPAPQRAAISLDKGHVTLRKNQSVSLVKTGAPLTRVRMGLGWDPATRGANIDLDASCIAFDARGAKIDTVWFMNLQAFGRAIAHSGDNLTGEGEGDDEVITVHLDRLPAEVHGLVFTVNSFLGQKFTKIARAFCRLVDDTTDTELVRYELSESEPRTGVLMCKIVRQGPAWTMTALGEFANGRTVRKLVNPARDALFRP